MLNRSFLALALAFILFHASTASAATGSQQQCKEMTVSGHGKSEGDALSDTGAQREAACPLASHDREILNYSCTKGTGGWDCTCTFLCCSKALTVGLQSIDR